MRSTGFYNTGARKTAAIQAEADDRIHGRLRPRLWARVPCSPTNRLSHRQVDEGLGEHVFGHAHVFPRCVAMAVVRGDRCEGRRQRFRCWSRRLRVFAKFGEDAIDAIVKDRLTVRPGEEVRLKIDPRRVHIFDRQSGARL